MPTRGLGNRYKLLGTGGPEGGPAPTILHMFLSFSEVSLSRSTLAVRPSPSHFATGILSFQFSVKVYSCCTFAGWGGGQFFPPWLNLFPVASCFLGRKIWTCNILLRYWDQLSSLQIYSPTYSYNRAEFIWHGNIERQRETQLMIQPVFCQRFTRQMLWIS
jgi:hypothetical protein